MRNKERKREKEREKERQEFLLGKRGKGKKREREGKSEKSQKSRGKLPFTFHPPKSDRCFGLVRLPAATTRRPTLDRGSREDKGQDRSRSWRYDYSSVDFKRELSRRIRPVGRPERAWPRLPGRRVDPYWRGTTRAAGMESTLAWTRLNGGMMAGLTTVWCDTPGRAWY